MLEHVCYVVLAQEWIRSLGRIVVGNTMGEILPIERASFEAKILGHDTVVAGRYNINDNPPGYGTLPPRRRRAGSGDAASYDGLFLCGHVWQLSRSL